MEELNITFIYNNSLNLQNTLYIGEAKKNVE